MEVVIYGVLTILAYLIALTVLLPFTLLLKFNKTICNKWFSWVFMKIIERHPELGAHRKILFDLLEEGLKLQRNASAALEILEIGIGGGPNLKFYPDNCRLTALEPNRYFEKYMLANLKKYPHVTYKRTITAKAESMKEVADASMDVVIATYVLCSVGNIRDALAEVKRVLKPGGKYLFLEHVAFPNNDWGFSVQRLANPLWALWMARCILTSEAAAAIHKAGFSDVCMERNYLKTPFFHVRPQIYGIATK